MSEIETKHITELKRPARRKDAIITDRLGRELKVGDVCVYSLTHFLVTGTALYVGVITKISSVSKSIYCKNIPMTGREISEEKKVKDRASIMKLDDEIMKEILLKKLTLSS